MDAQCPKLRMYLQKRFYCSLILHVRTPGCHTISGAWMTSQLNVSLMCKLRWSLICLAYFLTNYIHGCSYNQALADVRSTGARIKCLYCSVARNYKLHFCIETPFHGEKRVVPVARHLFPHDDLIYVELTA